MVKNTTTLPDANMLEKPAATALKSIGLGATFRAEPNDVKWLQRQWVRFRLVRLPTCGRRWAEITGGDEEGR